MAVYDRWHRKDGDEPCREHSRGRGKIYPSAVHGQASRWEVRWYDDTGRQRKRSFRVREGRDPNRCADAFDAMIQHQLDKGDYIDPASGDITFREFAEDWRRSRTHDTVTAEKVERRLRLHVYPVIGGRRMAELARRPSLIAAWIAGLTLRAPRVAIEDVSAIFRAAADDGIVTRNPVQASSVQRPGRGGSKAKPWTLSAVSAIAGALPPRYEVIPWLGSGTGMRQGELFGLAAEDVDFLRRVIHVRRQVKLIGNVLFYAPLKNRKPHDVPLPGSLAPLLARHMELHPPQEVTLDWHDLRDPERHGKPVTLRLVLSDGRGRALRRNRFNASVWAPARTAAGIGADGGGCHALRHTYASALLRRGVDVIRVAEWMGDTPQVVLSTYGHLMPGESGDDGRAAVDEFFSAPKPDSGSASQVP